MTNRKAKVKDAEEILMEVFDSEFETTQNKATFLMECLTNYRYIHELDEHGEQMVEPVFTGARADKIRDKLMELIDKM